MDLLQGAYSPSSISGFRNLIDQIQLNLEIDIFETKFNNKSEKYHLSVLGEKVETLNIFTSNWVNYKILYAFPPPSLTHKILFKWKIEKQGTMILVDPDWHSNMILFPVNQNEKVVTFISLSREPLSKDQLRDRSIRPFKISLNCLYIIKKFLQKISFKLLRNKLKHSTRSSTEKNIIRFIVKCMSGFATIDIYL